MKGYKITVTLERTLYVDDNIKDEVIEPLKALQIADKFLRSQGIKIPKLDMRDWSLVNTNIEEYDNSEKVQNSK